ncbi:MAG: FIST signal transduction protein [Planctomycetota bacterium]|jgi:small ligand-binding sensory domain FIST
MRFASSISSARTAEEAVEEVLAPVDRRVTPGMVDLVMLYSTAHFEDDLSYVIERVAEYFPAAVMLGCTAEGTIGDSQEMERTPSMSLLAASLPGVQIRPYHIQQSQLESAVDHLDWERFVGVAPESQPSFVALGDPFRIDVHEFVNKTNDLFPGSPIVGGIASAGHAPRQNRLIINGNVVREGIVGVALYGELEVTTIVSQGCRPIGKPFIITKGERNVIKQLGGKPVLEQLHQVMIDLPEEDERLARESLLIGRVIDEHKGEFSRGDFLIHNIIGVDRQSGAIGIAGHARAGTTVQFHVRDANSADDDLRKLLELREGSDTRGAMIFSCNGRGTNMWPQSGHDITLLHEVLGEVPAAGLFCGGEFGPVGGKNFIHGFTASIALFAPKSAEA